MAGVLGTTMHKRGDILSFGNSSTVFFFFNWGEKKIKTVSTVGSLPLLSNVKSANTEVTMETGNRWANI